MYITIMLIPVTWTVVAWNFDLEHFLCRLRSIAAHRDHFVRCLSGSHTFLVVTHSYVSQATHAFFRMLPLFLEWSEWKLLVQVSNQPLTFHSVVKVTFYLAVLSLCDICIYSVKLFAVVNIFLLPSTKEGNIALPMSISRYVGIP